MSYERLTKWSEAGTLHVFDFCGQEIPLSEATALNIDCIAGCLAKLEDKIESGELVDRNEYLDRLMNEKNISIMTDKEIEFFVKHNARVRGFMTVELARLTAENQRLKEEVAEQKSITAHEHAKQMEWFRIACDYKAKAALQKRLDNAVELPTACHNYVTRPPRSWQYVEELEE